MKRYLVVIRRLDRRIQGDAMKDYYVYILASERNGTLYIGVTSDLVRRVWEHKNGIKSGFASKYKAYQLVYYEHTNSVEAAIQREKRLKRYKREWKRELIEKQNPLWHDLYEEICQ